MSLNMLGAFHVGVAMVGADADATNIVDAGGGTGHGESRVSGSLSLANRPSAVVTTRTTVTGSRLVVQYGLPGATVATHTTVVANADATTLRGGAAHASTAVAASTLNLIGRIQSTQTAPIAGRTAVTGRMFFNVMALRATVNTRSGVFCNLIKPVFFAGSATGVTVVTGDEKTHILRGSILTRTTVVAQVANKGKIFGFIATRSTVSVVNGGFKLALLLPAGPIIGASSVKSRMHVYPMDFTDVVIHARSTATGRLALNSLIKTASAITGKTALVASLSAQLKLHAGVSSGRTVVAGSGRNGFGADLRCKSVVRGRVGISMGINTWRGSPIACRTTVTGIAPSNGFRGTAACATFPHVTITVGFAIRAAIAGFTALHSHFNGRFAHDGPVGSVNLTDVPHGDMGVPDEIGGLSSVAADVTVERSRMLSLIGNAGLALEKSLVVNGTAVGGNGVRVIGSPWKSVEPIAPHAILYV